MNNQDRQLLDVFVQESREHLDSLEPDILSLEADDNNDPTTINRIFRAVHSIKGASGFFGLENISKLAHVMENLMALIREGVFKPNRQIIDALLAGADKLRIMIENVDQSHTVDTSSEITALKNILNNDQTSPSASSNLPTFQSIFLPPDYLLRNAIQYGHCLYVIDLWLHKDIEKKNKTILDYFKEFESLGTIIDAYTHLDKSTSEDIFVSFLFSSAMQPDLVAGVFDVNSPQIKEIPIEEARNYLKNLPKSPSQTPTPTPQESQAPIPTSPTSIQSKPQPESITHSSDSPSSTPPEPQSSTPQTSSSTTQSKSSSKKTDETIRLPVALLDDLMNLAGEMVLSRNQLLRLVGKSNNQIEGISSILQNMNLVTSDLQEKIMQTRLQPIATIFSKFNRIVRDLAYKLNKEIELKTSGEEVELDKSIIESLSDPLTHLIRNCADHAIELPSEREAAHKTRHGTISLSAKHVGGHVHIEVIDDGAGIDPERIKRKALEKNVVSQEAAKAMSPQQLQNLIFLPGFSTAEKVSDVSGRGVGMDVVKTNIEALGGSVELDSEKGRGTRICLKLPLTLAIIPALIVGTKDRRFAIPQVNLEEIVLLNKNNRIEHIQSTKVLRLREKLLPLIDLNDILKIQETECTYVPTLKNKTGYVLVLKVEDHSYGLIIDKLYDSEEIVVKPLSNYLKSIPFYSGSTIMGDGKVAMILDTAGLCKADNLNLAEFNSKTQNLTDKASSHTNQDLQSFLLFRNEGSELLAINLSMVSRIEKVLSKDIEKVGNNEFIKYGSTSLRIIRLHDFMKLKSPSSEPPVLYAIIPKLVHQPLGIIAYKVEDAIQSANPLDRETISGPAILGSSIINNNLTIFIDPYQLFELADPQHYQASQSNALAHKRILIADDAPFFRTVVQNYLTELNCITDTAINGQNAWEKLNSNPYDLLITDIEMPSLNGIELASKIRSSPKLKSIPIVTLSAIPEEQQRLRAQNTFINAYHVKLNKERLRHTLESLLTVN